MKRTLLTLLFGVFILSTSTSQTTFSTKMPIDTNAGTNPYVVVSGLINNDAYPDLVVSAYNASTIKLYINNTDGSFAAPVTISSTLSQVGGISLADIDGINGLDIVAASYADNKAVWFANNGSGGFGTENVISSSVTDAAGIHTADVNNDTYIDVIVSVNGDDKVVWYANDGTGNFPGGENTIVSGLNQPGDIDMIDFDDDGDLDIVISTAEYAANGRVDVYYNDLIPGGSVAFTVDANPVTDSGNVYLFDVDFADVNDDGNIDILVSDSFGDLAWFNKELDGTYTKNIISISMANPGTVESADMDDDGYNDLVITNGGTAGNDLIWFESTDIGGFNSESVIDATQAQIFTLAIDDFDNDGDLDIATVDYQNFDVNWFENELYTLGSNDLTQNTFNIYPNPVKNKLYVKSLNNESYNVSVYDILGKNVVNSTISPNNPLDVSSLYNGIYIIKFEGHNKTFKFVKE
ncbi:T9SS type A sorting domain-containing protein [Gaetbulibacter sp. NE]|uniref:T9SS type A sorting domain-containing protein n=1 Tax=Gaetbulibacter sp. NE TaxID=2982307 RepID=UPI0021D2AD29|nr:T9SS type A sorting domain-containing protein [Gaetbulibacter sp. NE]